MIDKPIEAYALIVTALIPIIAMAAFFLGQSTMLLESRIPVCLGADTFTMDKPISAVELSHKNMCIKGFHFRL